MVGQTILALIHGWEYTNNERFGDRAGALKVFRISSFEYIKSNVLKIGQDFDFDDIIIV